MVEGESSDVSEMIRSYGTETYLSTQEDDEDAEVEITGVIYLKCQSALP